jgi:hypothetical protein
MEVVSSTPLSLWRGEKAPGTHWIRGWVDLRPGLNKVEKRKFLILPGLELRPLGRTRSGVSSSHRYHNLSISLSVSLSLSIYLYLWLYSPCGPCRFFSFFIYTQSVGLLGRGISPSQGRYLHTEEHKHNKRKHIHALSGNWTNCFSRRRWFMS